MLRDPVDSQTWLSRSYSSSDTRKYTRRLRGLKTDMRLTSHLHNWSQKVFGRRWVCAEGNRRILGLRSRELEVVGVRAVMRRACQVTQRALSILSQCRLRS